MPQDAKSAILTIETVKGKLTKTNAIFCGWCWSYV